MDEDIPNKCRYFSPRAPFTRCEIPPAYIIDKGYVGVGACSQHLGHLVKSALEDSFSAEVYTTRTWQLKTENG